MKLKKLFWANILTLALFTSCASKPIPIPGDSNKVRENTYNEYMNIADMYFDLEKYDKAVTYYKLCLEKKSLYWASYYKLAKTYALMSNWNEAAKMYGKILERDPENASVKSSIAYIYAMQGDTKKALEIYNELIQLQPENQEYLENYIAIQLLSKDLTDVEAPMALLNRDFPDSENIKKFQSTIDTIIAEKEQEKAEIEETKKDEESDKAEKKSEKNEEIENSDSKEE